MNMTQQKKRKLETVLSLRRREAQIADVVIKTNISRGIAESLTYAYWSDTSFSEKTCDPAANWSEQEIVIEVQYQWWNHYSRAHDTLCEYAQQSGYVSW